MPDDGRQKFGLSRRQKQVFDFIAESIKATGVAPSYDEIKIGCGAQSKGNMYAVVQTLIHKGHLASIPGKYRSLSLVSTTSPDVCPHCGGGL